MESISHNEYGLEGAYESMDTYLDSLSSDLFSNNENNNTSNHMDSQTGSPIHGPFYTLKSTPVSTPISSNESGIVSTPPSYKAMSRTQMKQELMRQKTAAEESRESELKKSQQSRQHATAAVPLVSTNILPSNADVPVPSVLPAQLLKVPTLLENPTSYHYEQIQQKKLRQILNDPTATSVPPLLGGSAVFVRHGLQHRLQHLLPGHKQAVSAPATVELTPIPQFDPVPSPGTYSRVSSVTSHGSANDDGANIIDTILDLEDDTSGLAEGLETLNCTESRDSACLTSSARRNTIGPSSSGSGKISHEDPSSLDKDRKRKDNHNQIERKRRFNINDRITELGKMLPKEGDPYHKEVADFRFHKGNILKGTVDYIKLLRKENDQLRVSHKDKEAENRRLLLQIKEYEELLKENHIQIPESRLTWRRVDSSNGLQHFLGSPPVVEVKREPQSEHPPPEPLEPPLVDIMEDDLLLGMDNIRGNDPMMPQAFHPEFRMDF